ncbi:haloacid dehalogenase-like hydrolase [Actinosynnema sp. NPDC050436]|uniref:HAD family hydrolase n=1 Tax=Actinosynnema sp. NPDC050436 TaxID=3155659 RepID=UPI0033CE4842
MPLTVGFDLDMTLIDPRPGMATVMDAVAAECGHPLDGAHFAANLGPPLDMVYRDRGVPEEEIPDLVARFRALYPEIVIPATVALPGAAQSLAAVRELGGRTLVVTGKYRANAALHLAAFGWEVDELFGELWSTGKGEALRSAGASVYVGDHVGDVRGARAAGAVAVGVVSGPCSREELVDEGADVVLPSLDLFPDWLRENAATLAGGSCARR